MCITTQIQHIRENWAIDYAKQARDCSEDGEFEDVQIELAAGKKPVEGEVYYYYSGPLDEKTRPFCRTLLSIDKLYSEADFEKFNSLLGYNVFLHEGGFNCRHIWLQRIRKTGTVVNRNDLDKAAVKQPNDLGKYY